METTGFHRRGTLKSHTNIQKGKTQRTSALDGLRKSDRSRRLEKKRHRLRIDSGAVTPEPLQIFQDIKGLLANPSLDPRGEITKAALVQLGKDLGHTDAHSWACSEDKVFDLFKETVMIPILEASALDMLAHVSAAPNVDISGFTEALAVLFKQVVPDSQASIHQKESTWIVIKNMLVEDFIPDDRYSNNEKLTITTCRTMAAAALCELGRAAQGNGTLQVPSLEPTAIWTYAWSVVSVINSIILSDNVAHALFVDQENECSSALRSILHRAAKNLCAELDNRQDEEKHYWGFTEDPNFAVEKTLWHAWCASEILWVFITNLELCADVTRPPSFMQNYEPVLQLITSLLAVLHRLQQKNITIDCPPGTELWSHLHLSGVAVPCMQFMRLACRPTANQAERKILSLYVEQLNDVITAGLSMKHRGIHKAALGILAMAASSSPAARPLVDRNFSTILNILAEVPQFDIAEQGLLIFLSAIRWSHEYRDRATYAKPCVAISAVKILKANAHSEYTVTLVLELLEELLPRDYNLRRELYECDAITMLEGAQFIHTDVIERRISCIVERYFDEFGDESQMIPAVQ